MSVVTITKENFDEEVVKSDKTVLLDFWASWCGPCKALSPVVDKIANEHPEIKVGKVNVDDQGKLAEQFHVMNIPTLVVMKGGEAVNTAVGLRPEEEILKLL